MVSLISIIEGLLLIVPALLSVAFVTIAERKTMASMQRRLGPNAVGYYGLLQAFADALKLLLKEYVAPTQANIILFFLGPMITLIFSLLGYLVVPFGSGLFVSDYSLGMLYMLAVSSLATYGILLAGWSANSKYAFLGSLRSTAQLISYELILSSVILLVILLTGNLNMITIVESQRVVDFLLPLFPLFIIFFIGSIAETNRAPFDLAEAESELVSGFMTEHSASIFVFFFLAEYASIILICVLNSILFLGGYLCIIPVDFLISILNTVFSIDHAILEELFSNVSSSPLNLALKTGLLIFVFIWVRASFPRIRFDQLMSVCWTVLLPLIIAYVVLLPCIVFGLDALPTQILL
jgi:NADH-ubiquinone oxidoreductase chain 1